MIPGGLRRAAGAMNVLERRQEAVSHNLANTATPGFRGERVFAQVLDDMGMTPLAHAATDTRSGGLTTTGRPLDLALTGSEGFLVVDTPQGERWVRGGSFSLDPDGRIVDTHGNALLGTEGPLVLPDGTVEVTTTGEVRVDGEPVDQLRRERPADGVALQREGAGQFVPTDAAERLPADALRIHAQQLEESNVEPVGAMVEMMEIQRNYTTLQRSVQVIDEVLATLSNEIGRVG